jgi:hypothetical protein
MNRTKLYITIVCLLCIIIGVFLYFNINFASENTIRGVWQRTRIPGESSVELNTVENHPGELSKFLVFTDNNKFQSSAGGDVIAHGTYSFLDNNRIELKIEGISAVYDIRIVGNWLSLRNNLIGYDFYRSELPPPFQ